MTEKSTSASVDDQQVTYFSIGLMIVVVVSLIVVYGIAYAQQSQADSYQNKIESLEQELVEYEDVESKALALGIQEDELESLYSSQETYAKLVNELSKQAVKGTKLNSVSMDGDGLQIQGTATSYLNVNKQVVAYEAIENIDTVMLGSAIDGQDGVQFNLTATLK
jgi:Tfp pilus assembly protein PilN